MATDKIATQRLAKIYANRGDPNGWFEASSTALVAVYQRPHPSIVDPNITEAIVP